MSSLYVLDWHHRTFGYMNNFQLTSETPSPEHKIGNIVQISDGQWVPPLQPSAPPISANCDHSSCHKFCCVGSQEKESGIIMGKSIQFNVPMHKSNFAQPSSMKAVPSNMQLPLASGVNIEILTVNATIDGRYCVENSCKPRHGLYTLYVPVSPYMPTVALEMRIDVVDINSYIDNCGAIRDFAHKTCSPYHHARPDSSRISTTRKITDDVFELSVGDFTHSAYRFRIGYSAESCSMSESQRGRNFDEYNIIFYRKCQKS